MSKKMKMCYIPTCPSTSINTDKKFVEVPRVNPRRFQWLTAANVDTNCIGRLYCCEDHFDVQKDFTNFQRHKRYGSKLIYANMSVCPSLYLDSPPPTFLQKTRKKKRRRPKLDSENSQSDTKRFQFVDVDHTTEDVKPQVTFQPEDVHPQEVLIKDEPTEIDIKEEMWPMLMLESQFESGDDTLIEEDQPSLVSLSENYLNNKKSKAREIIPPTVQVPHKCSNCRFSIGPTSVKDMIDFDDPYKKASMHFDKSQRQMSTLQVIQMSPKFYLGMPINMMHILKSVSANEKIFPLDLLITLTKIRLNDPFMRLSIDFGLSETRSRDIFKETVPKVARALANFIGWSGPQSFFINIFKLESFIRDPLGREKTLDKDDDPNAYTMKCLVCHNRAGAVSFVSTIFPAKMSDIEVIAYSEVLNSVPTWAQLFLLSHLDLQHKRTQEGLFYLDKYMEKNKVTATRKEFLDVLYKSIGSRMSVLDKVDEKKRVTVDIVELLSEFGILKNHSKASKDIVVIMHDIVKIVCALINIEQLSLSL